MRKPNIQLQKLSLKHIDQYNALLRYAFQVTEKTLLEYNWEADEIRKSKFPVLEHASVFGCFDEENLVSQFAVYPIKMNIHSETYSVGFITSVATYPEYSGMGLMTKLMKQSLNEMRDKGQSLAVLYPYSIPLYRHRGWEIISDVMTWRLKVSQLPKTKNISGYVRRVSIDSEELINLHNAFAQATHGCLFRNKLAWEEYWRWDVDDTMVCIYYGQNDRALGYMVYRIDEDIMYVKEMIYLNQEAKNGLFHYIEAHENMIDEVKGNNYFGRPIAFSLYDSDIKETIRPYIMGRIIDVEQFLLQYRFQCETEDLKFTLHVHDPFLEWNNKSFTFSIHEGRVRLDQGKTPYEATLSIGTLTALLMGYIDAADLSELERIQASEKTIDLLDDLIIRGKPYISDYI